MEVYIKNMVCPRCIAAVEDLFTKENIAFEKVSLGLVETQEDLSPEKIQELQPKLEKLGFELIDDRKKQIVDQVKKVIIQTIHFPDEDIPKKNISELLTQQLPYDYKYLSTLFSEITGTTIEKFYITHKIEKAKELIVYDQMSLKEIAFFLGYSSEAYMSNQFKKVTGYTPGQYKKLGLQKRRTLDQI